MAKRTQSAQSNKYGNANGELQGAGHPHELWRKWRSLRTIFVAAAMLVICFALLVWWINAQKFERTEDAYVTGHIHAMSFRVSGTISEVRIDDNELRSAMLAVDAELRAGGVGGSLLVESLANVLAVHLIRHITGPRRLNASADGALPRHKLRRVIEYIMENLGGSPTLKQMAAVVPLRSYPFAAPF